MEIKARIKKNKFWQQLLAMIVTVFLASTSMITVVPTNAANIPVNGGTTTFNTYLVMNANANVPNVTFSFSIAPGTAVAASGDNPAIYAGIGTPIVGSATFTANDKDTTPGTPTDSSLSNRKYATKEVTVDFSGISFNAPGIYRYVVTESENTDSGITNDSLNTRTLDVYVEYAENSDRELIVGGYVLHTGIQATPTQEQKSSGFTNTYTTYDLTLTKNVTGNQGDRDKYFEFTINITNAKPETVYTVDLPGSENDNRNTDTIVVGEKGTATVNYYLKDNQSIVIQGLTATTKYQITETDYSGDGYTTTYKLDGGAAATGNTFDAESMGSGNHTVTFTNNKEGTVPTGIILESAPYLILGVVVIAGAVALFVTGRRRTN